MSTGKTREGASRRRLLPVACQAGTHEGLQTETAGRRGSVVAVLPYPAFIIIIIIYLLPAIGWSPGGRSQLHFVHVIQFHGLPTVPLFTSGWGYMGSM